MPAQKEEKSYLCGSFFERLAASVIDFFILLPFAFALLAFTSLLFFGLPKWQNVFLGNLLVLILAIIYNVFFLSQYEATIGKKIMRLKVKTSSYGRITLGDALWREVIGKLASKIIFNLGYLWVLIDKRRQGWHDKIAKTYVVKTDKEGHLFPGENPSITSSSIITFFALSLFGALFFLLNFLSLFSFLIAQPHQVKGEAMAPTLKNGQYILTNKFEYQLQSPQRGDIIIFRSPKEKNADYLKRIIGLPGERVKIQDGKVYINSIPLAEPYLAPEVETTLWPEQSMEEGEEIKVPQRSYFVLGDNREHSLDSRDFGSIEKNLIIGKFWFRYL